MPFTVPLEVLGMMIAGDVGDFTIYTDKFGRKIIFPFSPPEKPPSSRQLAQRQVFRQAVEGWKNLNPDQRAAWEQASRTCGLCMTGHNAFVHFWLTQDFAALATLERQAGLSLVLS